MELTNLKSTWQNAGDASRSEKDLLRMTKVLNHPSIKKIRVKFVVEFIGLAFFLFIYNDWFDGDQKPFLANLLLAGSLILYMFNNVIGYVVLLKPVSSGNLKASVENYRARIKRLAAFSLVISFVYGISIITFFSMVIAFTQSKYLLLLGIFAVLFLLTYFSYRIWMQWIRNLKHQVEEFEMN